MAKAKIQASPASADQIAAYEQLVARIDAGALDHLVDAHAAIATKPYNRVADRAANLAYETGRIDDDDHVVGASDTAAEISRIAARLPGAVDLAYALLVSDLLDDDEYRTLTSWADAGQPASSAQEFQPPSSPRRERITEPAAAGVVAPPAAAVEPVEVPTPVEQSVEPPAEPVRVRPRRPVSPAPKMQDPRRIYKRLRIARAASWAIFVVSFVLIGPTLGEGAFHITLACLGGALAGLAGGFALTFSIRRIRRINHLSI